MSGPGQLRRFAAATSRGLHRPRNEDALSVAGALLVDEVMPPLCGELPGPGGDGGSPAVLVVADGMGGHAQGALASREVASLIAAGRDELLTSEGCAGAVHGANLHLHGLMRGQPALAGMGTTVAGVAAHGSWLCWFNVGDTRIYRLRDGQLRQISVDDRWRAGTVHGPGDRGAPGSTHALLQALGGTRAVVPVRPHVGREALLDGDRVLLCSDGLTDMVTDGGIAAILRSCPVLAEAARLLVEAALGAGGRDNVSVILAQ